MIASSLLIVETRDQCRAVPFSDAARGQLSDIASAGLSGSSMMIILPPRPVKMPPTEVASPRASLRRHDFGFGIFGGIDLGAREKYAGTNLRS